MQGFGGKFGVQNDRMDKSAISFKENPEQIGTNYTKTKPDIGNVTLILTINKSSIQSNYFVFFFVK